MRIIYDDLPEFVEARLRCERTRQKLKCEWCPLYDRCAIDEEDGLRTMHCDILSMQKGAAEKNAD